MFFGICTSAGTALNCGIETMQARHAPSRPSAICRALLCQPTLERPARSSTQAGKQAESLRSNLGNATHPPTSLRHSTHRRHLNKIFVCWFFLKKSLVGQNLEPIKYFGDNFVRQSGKSAGTSYFFLQQQILKKAMPLYFFFPRWTQQLRPNVSGKSHTFYLVFLLLEIQHVYVVQLVFSAQQKIGDGAHQLASTSNFLRFHILTEKAKR